MIIRFIFLIIFGYIYSLEKNITTIEKFITVIIFVVFGTFFLELLKSIIKGFMIKDERKVIRKIFNKSFMMLMPFLIFAIVSRFYLKWDMVLAYFTTGILTSGGVLVSELHGKIKMKKLLPLFITIYHSIFGAVLMNVGKILEKIGGSL